MANSGSPKDQSYVHGYPKPLSPVLRGSHLHYNTEASGKCWQSLICIYYILEPSAAI